MLNLPLSVWKEHPMQCLKVPCNQARTMNEYYISVFPVSEQHISLGAVGKSMLSKQLGQSDPNSQDQTELDNQVKVLCVELVMPGLELSPDPPPHKIVLCCHQQVSCVSQLLHCHVPSQYLIDCLDQMNIYTIGSHMACGSHIGI